MKDNSKQEYRRKDGKNAKRYERTVTTTKICPICGEQFEARAWNRKTCYKKECELKNTMIMIDSRAERMKEGNTNVPYNKEFECERCHNKFIKHTTKRKIYRFCDDCVEVIKRETYLYNRIQKYGTASTVIGSGNNQWGRSNNNYKTGEFSIFEKMPEIIGIHRYQKIYSDYNLPNECYFCGIKDTETHKNDIHHKDGNHQNNSPENLMKLCRSCHKKIHYLYKYLGIETANIFKN